MWKRLLREESFGYQPRHLDFHPSGRWDFVTLEAQQKLLVYKRSSDGTFGPDALFTKETLKEPGNVRNGQVLGTVRVDRSGKFLYAVNRASGSTKVDGKSVFASGGENSIVVFAINQTTGEPTRIQTIDTHGLHARTMRTGSERQNPGCVQHGPTLRARCRRYARRCRLNLAVFRVGADAGSSHS